MLTHHGLLGGYSLSFEFIISDLRLSAAIYKSLCSTVLSICCEQPDRKSLSSACYLCGHHFWSQATFHESQRASSSIASFFLQIPSFYNKTLFLRLGVQRVQYATSFCIFLYSNQLLTFSITCILFTMYIIAMT